MSSETNGTDPTNLTAPQIKMEQALSELQSSLYAPEDQASILGQEYAFDKVNELSRINHSPAEITILSKPIATFIPPSTKLAPGFLTQKNIKLDDPTAYTGSAKFLRTTFSRLKDKIEPKRALFNAALSAAHYGQAEYFEGYDGNGRRRDFTLAETVDDEPGSAVSIAELKGMAKCMERSAVAHNILTMYGVTSQLETGRLTIMKPDGTQSTENHAFLRITQLNGEEMLFDVMNPIYVDRKDGSRDAKPSLYAIEAGSREPVTAELIQQKRGIDGLQSTVAANLTFEFTDIAA
ncbi:hypothetical protein H7097_04265 [Aeromicrobium sp.]|nr:hypothetical protein [Candidatus Saccharibacteria bacterium]